MLRHVMLPFLIIVLLLSACGGSEPEVDVQATEIAAAVAATMAAQAPPPTVVVTPPPPPTVVVAPSSLPTEAPAPTPEPEADPMDIQLEADGSGDYAGLAEALNAAPTGATISLGPGSHRLEKAQLVTKAVRLIGAGMDDTEIVSAAPRFVLFFEGDGPFVAQEVTFRHEGDEKADVVGVSGGEISFARTRFTGAKWDDETDDGSGLFITGDTTGTVGDSAATGNELHGFYVIGTAHPVLETNNCSDNGQSGIVYHEGAGGIARQNNCSGNGHHGFYLWGEPAPTLEANTCSDNGDTGIAYFGQSAGFARGNECANNAAHGIAVMDEAQPALDGNNLHDNGDTGIAFFDEAGGGAQANTCTGNAYHGIYVGDSAAPHIGKNDCELGGTLGTGAPSAAEGKIAYAATGDASREIWVMNADGSEPAQLTDNKVDDHAPTWSPDGTRIAYVSVVDNNGQIHVMHADGSGDIRIAEELKSASEPAWSPDGSRIAIVSSEGGGEIYVVRPDGSDLTQLTDHEAMDFCPSWSPNGQQLAFVSNRDGQNEIYIMETDDGSPTKVSDSLGWLYGARWSPDGRRFLFVEDDVVHTMTANGYDYKRVTGEVDYTSTAAWSPDGQRLIFQVDGDLFVANADGNAPTQLTEDKAKNGYPAWWAPPESISFPTRFNPGGNPWCFHEPETRAAGDWQIAAPDDMVFLGESAEIGLYNQAGDGQTYSVTARVVAPNESETRVETTMVNGEWVSVIYPDDFDQANTEQRGTYTIIWENDGTYIGCYGFGVGGGAGP